MPTGPKAVPGCFCMNKLGNCMAQCVMDSHGNKRGSSWIPSVSVEYKRLGNRESDWNLACGSSLTTSTSGSSSGRSTRYGGTGRPNLTRKVLDEATSSEEEWSAGSNDSEEEELEDVVEEEEEEVEKPVSTRCILEVSSLLETLTSNVRCATCGGPVDALVKTLCLASRISITCKDPECAFVYNSAAPAAAILDEKDDDRERTTDYAVNIAYVLGFVASGDGGAEAGRVLGLLGLPNDTTMESRSFPTIEERINPKLEKLANEILVENLVEEVRLTFLAANINDSDFELWKSALTNPEVQLDRSKYPLIDVSFDMGWQQRSSGRKYNSPSGHALFVGHKSQKAVAMVLKSKLCAVCIAWPKNAKNTGKPIPWHICRKNHTGTSSAMEPIACLDMVVMLFDKRRCIVSKICIDDDASTRSLLRWSNADYMVNNNTTEIPKVAKTRGNDIGGEQDRPDNGKLPGHIPEPLFVADPNHRRKGFTGELQGILKEKVAQRYTLTRNDTMRLEKNFGYMARTLKNRPDTEFVNAGKAVLDHHFDSHTYCTEWCPRKRMSEEQLKQSKRFYRCMTRDAELYKELMKKVGRYLTFDKLKDMISYGMDTQVNESFNNTFSWFAPKNKLYCASASLSNRLSLAIGIHSIGLVRYWTRCFKAFGISVTPAITHFLEAKQSVRSRKHAKSKTTRAKKERMQHRYDRMKVDEADARMARAKREGTYQKGMNMQEFGADGYTEDELRALAASRPAKKARTSAQQMDITCKHCGGKGHSTTRSAKCAKYKQPTVVLQEIQPLVLPGQDAELLRIDAAADVLALDMLALREEDILAQEQEQDGTSGAI
jgi:hypothetical protein